MTSIFRAALWMIGSIISFSVMAIAGRTVSAYHDTFELMAYRSMVGFIIIISLACFMGKLTAYRTNRVGLHLLRNLAHFTGQNLWFYALTVIPLAQVFALEFTSPIWVALLAPLFLAEKLTFIRLISVVLGCVGILIIANPGSTQISTGTLMAASSAIAFAFTAIFTRKLTQTDAIWTILFWLTASQLIFGTICAGYDGVVNLPTWQSLPYLVVIGIAGLTAHFSLTSALSLAPASIVIPIDFVRLPVIAIAGALLYGESLSISLVIGAVFIIAGNILNIRSSSRVKVSATAPK